MTGRTRVGTSGWVYPHWWGTFYPEELRQADRLAYYAERLRTVEVNNTYYRLPSAAALASWQRAVPPEFVFAFKAHRYITHRKKLVDAEDGLARFLESLEPIEARTGVVLFQLPPFLGFDPERLDAFLGLLPRGKPYRYVFEFRNPTWSNPQTLEILALHDVGYCIHDFEGQPLVEVTASTVYVRLHGPTGPYRGRYARKALETWARRARAWNREGRDVWIYFNNDQAAYAAHNAMELSAMLAPVPHGSAAASGGADARSHA